MPKLVYLAQHRADYEGGSTLSVHHTLAGAKARVEEYVRETRDWLDLPETFEWNQYSETVSILVFDFGVDHYTVIALEVQD